MSKVLVYSPDHSKAGYFATQRIFNEPETFIFPTNSKEYVLTQFPCYDKIIVIDDDPFADKIREYHKNVVKACSMRMAQGNFENQLISFLIEFGIRNLWIFMWQHVAIMWHKILKFFGYKVLVTELLLERIGHLAYNTYILCNIAKRDKIKRIYCPQPSYIASPTMLNFFKKYLNFSDKIAKYLLMMPAIRNSEFFIDARYLLEAFYPLKDLPKITLKFTKEQEQRGREFLRKLGISDNDRFVCINNRDQKYLETISKVDWSYHKFRNCSIKNFKKAIDYIVGQGGHVIRIGLFPEEKIQNTDKIHDISDQDEFFHIYCAAKCSFAIGSYTGLGVVYKLFDRPMLCVNQAQVELLTIFDERDLLLPKHFWDNRLGRYLTLKEVIHAGYGRVVRGDSLVDIDIEENTEEEIYLATKEFIDHLDHGHQLKRGELAEALDFDGCISKGVKINLASCWAPAPLRR